MAISHVNTQNATQGSSASVTATKPTGTAENDVLIAFLTSNNQNCTPPAGWTEVTEVDVVEGVFRFQLFYKVAGASEPASYAFSVPVSTILVLTVSAWRLVDTVTPFDIDPSVVASLTQSEPYSTPTISGGTRGRVLYYRAARDNTTTPITFTESTSGVSELSDTGVTDGSSVSYSGALFADDGDYETSGSKSGLAVTASATETHNVAMTLALKASSASGPLVAELALPSMESDAAVEIPGSMDAELPLFEFEMDGWYGNTEATLDVVVPVGVTIAGTPHTQGDLDVSVTTISMSSFAETRRFAENIVNVEDESRWLIVYQDDIRLGNRKTALKEAVLGASVPIEVSFDVYADIQGIPASATATAYGATISFDTKTDAPAGHVSVSCLSVAR